MRRVALLLVVPVAVAGCGVSARQVRSPGATLVPVVREAPTPALPVTVASTDGRQVTVADVSRVVALSLSGTLAEIVVDLGLHERLVGRDVSSDFPQTRALPVVTQAHQLNAEAILALSPTLVLTDASMGPTQALDALRQSGVPVVLVPEAWSLDQVYPRITAVADALGVPEVGNSLASRTRADVAAAVEALPSFTTPPRLAFLYLRGSVGVYLMAGRGSGADSLFRAIGAIDAGTEIGLERFRPLTSEGLVRAAPDVLIVMDKGLASVGGEDGLLKVAGVAQTPAGRHRRVVTLDDSSVLSFGPRTGQVVQQLAEGVAAELAS